MQEQAKNIITIQNLSIGYPQKKEDVVVAKHINLQLSQGKLISIIGKNGIGKSTLLRTLCKVQKPLAGEIFIHQKNLANYNDIALAKHMSLVLTERLPESQLTVFELIALGRQPYTNWFDSLSKEDIEKIKWAITVTEITHLQHKPFYELSDGQLQRVLIARALAQDTEIIILDEPTAHLDLYNKVKILHLLKDLVNTTNKTIIMSTHEINLAIQLADEIVLFKKDMVCSNTPDVFIKEGAFDDLFPENSIYFNKTLQQFTLTKK